MTRVLPVFVALVLLVGTARAELHLQCEFGGATRSVAGVENRRPYVLDGERRIPVPRDARWHLRGNVRENHALMLWSPAYGIAQKDSPDWRRAAEERPFLGGVSLTHALERFGKKEESDLLKTWPAGSKDALVVFAWVVDGRIVAAAARALPDSAQSKFFQASHTFKLTAAEARGQGVVLMWRDGSFVSPVPRFGDPQQQRAFVAVVLDDAGALQKLLADGVPATATDAEGYSLLHFAAEAGHVAVIDMLTAAGAKARAAKPTTATPLDWAIEKGRTDAVAKLLASGASPNDIRDGRIPPLISAIEHQHPNIALQLIAAKASLKAKGPLGQTAATAALDEGQTDVLREILRLENVLSFDHEQMDRVLVTQAAKGHTAMVKFMLERGLPSAREVRGLTPLMAGAISGDPELARALLAAKARPKQAAPDGETALSMAVQNGNVEYARVVLDAGADVNAKRKDGVTALHLAATRDAAALVELLMERGADSGAATSAGMTALNVALSRRAKHAAQALAARGARLNVKSTAFQADLETAITLDVAPLIKAALADGWTPATKLPGGWLPLQVAELSGAKDCAAVLREAGAPSDFAGAPVVVAAGELDARPKLVTARPPMDPRDPDDEYGSETIRVELIIDRDGRTRFARPASRGDALLTASAVQGLTEWTFAPPTRGGQPVAARAAIPVTFPSSSDRAVDALEVDVLPAPVKRAAPMYPSHLRRAGYAGQVSLRFTVNVEGRPEKIRVHRSTHPDFEASAIDALKQWVFKPAMRDGRPVPMETEVPIVFNLVDE